MKSIQTVTIHLCILILWNTLAYSQNWSAEIFDKKTLAAFDRTDGSCLLFLATSENEVEIAEITAEGVYQSKRNLAIDAEFLQPVIRTADEGYLLPFYDYLSDSTTLLKLDQHLNEVFARIYFFNSNFIHSLREINNRELLWMIYKTGEGSFLYKLSPQGDTVSSVHLSYDYLSDYDSLVLQQGVIYTNEDTIVAVKQNGEKLWEIKSITDYPDITTLSNGYLVSTADSIYRLDASGNIAWRKGSELYPSGFYLFKGQTDSFYDYHWEDNNRYGTNFLTKFNEDGNVMWKCMVDSSDIYDFTIHSINEQKESIIVAASHFASDSTYCYILHINNDGNIIEKRLLEVTDSEIISFSLFGNGTDYYSYINFEDRTEVNKISDLKISGLTKAEIKKLVLPLKLEYYNIQGRLMEEYFTDHYTNEFPLSLPPGIYLRKLEDANGSMMIQKMINRN